MSRRPVITLTTDFGRDDFYVAAMKGVLLQGCPEATIIDVTHTIPPQDVAAGSFILERAVAAFGPGTIHIAVVDPGVGTGRRILLAEVAGSTVICPDNGLITWTIRRHPTTTREMTWRPKSASHTFHGRDVMAPIAARLAVGESFNFPPIEPVLLDIDLSPLGRKGVVIYIDVYGNATTNIAADWVDASGDWYAAGRHIGRLRRTYADVSPGQPLALVGSSGLLEIAVRDGSAARVLDLKVGDSVWQL